MEGPLYYLDEVDTSEDDGDTELEVDQLKVLKRETIDYWILLAQLGFLFI